MLLVSLETTMSDLPSTFRPRRDQDRAVRVATSAAPGKYVDHAERHRERHWDLPLQRQVELAAVQIEIRPVACSRCLGGQWSAVV